MLLVQYSECIVSTTGVGTKSLWCLPSLRELLFNILLSFVVPERGVSRRGRRTKRPSQRTTPSGRVQTLRWRELTIQPAVAVAEKTRSRSLPRGWTPSRASCLPPSAERCAGVVLVDISCLGTSDFESAVVWPYDTMLLRSSLRCFSAIRVTFAYYFTASLALLAVRIQDNEKKAPVQTACIMGTRAMMRQSQTKHGLSQHGIH